MPVALHDSLVLSWKKGANKLKIEQGLNGHAKLIAFEWTWIKQLVTAFDYRGHVRMSVFILVCWSFLLRPLSEAFPIQAGNQQEASSLPFGKHSGI